MARVLPTCLIFIFFVLGGIARLTGFSIWKFINTLRKSF